MTVAVPGMYDDTGLEDVGQSDVIIPRLRIVHTEGLFENNLSKQRFEKMKVIILGLVKQRIMWHSSVEDGDVPQCKSPNFEFGIPNISDKGRKETRFPFERSNFSRSDARPVEIEASKSYPDGWSSNGNPVLNCASCSFSQWGSDSTPPACSEQHTYPLLYCASEEDDQWLPALYTVQKVGIKPSRQYVSSFAQTKTPMFTVYTEIGLSLSSRGSVKYSVPTFRKLESTDQNMWLEYRDQMRGIREFIRRAPRPPEEHEIGASSSNENAAPAVEATPVTAAAAPKVLTPEPTNDGDDDLPF